MANKMLLQVRGLVVAANQAVVPYIAGLQEVSPARIVDVYRTSWRILSFVTPPCFAALAGMAPVISVLWLGSLQNDFVIFSIILAIANAVNVFSGPAYFSNLGEGELLLNAIAHVVMAVANCVLGLVLGYLFGAFGVVTANGLAIVLGSVLVVWAFHSRKQVAVGKLFSAQDLAVGVSCGLAALASAVVFQYLAPTYRLATVGAAMVCVFVGIIALPLWRHSARAWFGSKLRALGRGID